MINEYQKQHVDSPLWCFSPVWNLLPQSCLCCLHCRVSPRQMWASLRKVVSDHSVFSAFFFFFNKQYIRENSESPEIGVEVRNISFKCSLTSTRSASLRTALWRGALQQTSQQAARQELELRKLLISTEDHHGTFKHVVTPYVLGGLWVGKLGFNLGSLQMKPFKIAGMVWVCL